MEEQEILNLLKDYLDEERYIHSLGVMDSAVKLAKRYGSDTEKARLAGLIHDCAKELPRKTMIQKVKEANIILDEATLQNGALMHGPVGAIMAKEVFGVKDPEVLNAIECHTTGKKGMGLLDKIIYLADYIEPNRNEPYVEKLRHLAMEDLDRAILYALERTIRHVLDTGRILHPRTVDARNHMLKNVKNITK